MPSSTLPGDLKPALERRKKRAVYPKIESHYAVGQATVRPASVSLGLPPKVRTGSNVASLRTVES
jgi:hypothetical protein